MAASGQNEDQDPDTPGDGEGHLLPNLLKMLFLIAVLGGFWYFFDRWLSGR